MKIVKNKSRGKRFILRGYGELDPTAQLVCVDVFSDEEYERGAAFESIRHLAGLTKKDTAKLLGCRTSDISGIESGSKWFSSSEEFEEAKSLLGRRE